jgi:hypothetical protein
MKTSIILLAITILFSTAGCDKNGDNNITGDNVFATISSGSWRVTFFSDNNQEETSNFTGYVFSFSQSSIVTAVNGGTTVTGSWVMGSDNSTIKVVITFTSPSNFAELSEDWNVIERTDTKIRLQHVSGGGGGTKYLTFEKI